LYEKGFIRGKRKQDATMRVVRKKLNKRTRKEEKGQTGSAEEKENSLQENICLKASRAVQA